MRVRLVISGLVFTVALAVLVFVHARWMARAPRDPRFVRFMRRNNLRANANEVIPERGKAVDRRGRPLDVAEAGSTFQKVVDELHLASGAPVPLTIDAELQAKAEALMDGKRGAVVALEPATGRIRALVNAPRAAYLNRALNGLYPPAQLWGKLPLAVRKTSFLIQFLSGVRERPTGSCHPHHQAQAYSPRGSPSTMLYSTCPLGPESWS